MQERQIEITPKFCHNVAGEEKITKYKTLTNIAPTNNNYFEKFYNYNITLILKHKNTQYYYNKTIIKTNQYDFICFINKINRYD